jgi:RNA polymerase sigma factor (sigma-70 family)
MTMNSSRGKRKREGFARVLTPEQQELVLGCTKLAYSIAARFASRYGLDYHESCSVAVIQLCRAATYFEPSRGIPFSSFAWLSVERALNRFKKIEFRRVHAVPFSVMDGDEDDRGFDPADGSSLRLEGEVLNRDVLDRLRKFLPPRAWDVLYAHFIEDRTLQEIGLSLGITREAVRQTLSRALPKCRLILGEVLPASESKPPVAEAEFAPDLR